MKRIIAVIFTISVIAVAVPRAEAGMISTTTIVSITTWLGEVKGELDTAFGSVSGTTTVKGKISEVESDIKGSSETDVLIDLLVLADRAQTRATPENVSTRFAKEFIRGLDRHIRIRRATSAYTGLDSFLTYYGITVSTDFAEISNASGVVISTTNY